MFNSEAYSYFHNGDYKKAIDAYDEALKKVAAGNRAEEQSRTFESIILSQILGPR